MKVIKEVAFVRTESDCTWRRGLSSLIKRKKCFINETVKLVLALFLRW